MSDSSVADPHDPAPQAPTPHPVDGTYTSKPEFNKYTASVAEPPFPESLVFAVTVAPLVSFAVIS